MNEIILVGDRVLIEPTTADQETATGLILPASVSEKEKIHAGRVVQVGPGYITPNPEYTGDPWAAQREAVRYLPLQAEPGDMAYFLRKEALELTFEGTPYLIVPHAAIVALVRPQHAPSGASGLGLDDLLG